MADPRIRYDVLANAQGEEDVRRLAAELEKLDDAFDPETAAKAKRLAQELGELGQQAAGLDTFQRALVNANEAGRRLDESSEALRKLRQQLEGVNEPTRKQAGDLQRLIDREREAQSAYTASTAALAAARSATQGLGVSTDDLAGSEARLAQALSAAKGEAVELAAAYQRNEKAAQESAAAMRQLEDAAARTQAETAELAKSLRATETAAADYAAATERGATALDGEINALRARETAAQRLLLTDRDLNESQRELANARDRGRMALLAEAQALDRTAAAARQSQAATVAAAEAARRAGAAIESAFGATGVRSIDAIETEIEQTAAALVRLTSEARRGGIGLDDLNRAAGAAEVKIARLRAEIAQVDRIPGVFERASNGLNNLIGRFGALTAVITTVGFAVRPAVESFIALETTARILTNVTGSAGQAATQIEFLRTTAQRSGQSFDTLAEGYAKFAASALQTGLSVQQTQAVFLSLANASGALGISTEKSGRALEALSQIASKGVVSMEELRGQLGDALPGVLPALAKELGLTTQELGKVVESGQLLATEAIPAIGRALQQLAGSGEPVQGLVANFQRLKNVVLEASNVIATGAFGAALGAGLSFVAERVKELAFLVALVGESFTVVGRQIGVTIAAIVSRDFSQLSQALRDIEGESTSRLLGLASRIKGVGSAGTEAAVGTRELASAAAEAASKALDGAEATDVQRQSLARLSLDLGRAIEGSERQSQALDKVAAARKVELDLVTKYASESGFEAGQRADVVTASERFQQALTDVLDARQRELDLLEDAIALTTAEVLARGGSKQAAEAATEVFRKEAEARTANLEVTKAQVSQADAATRAAALEAQTAKDNAARYGELATAARNAEIVLEDVRKAYGRGKASQDELAAATRNLTDAKKLLKDALNDQNEASKRAVDTIKVESEFTRAQINLERTRLTIERDKLLAQGAETAARRISNQIRELDLQLTENATQAKRAEANEIIRSTALLRSQLEAQGLLTPARKEELDLIIKKQQAVILDTDAAALNEGAQRKNNEAVARGSSTRSDYNKTVADGTRGTRDNTSATDDNTRSKAENARIAKELAKAYVNLLASDRALGGADGLAGGIGPRQDGVNFGIRSPTGVRSAGGPANQLPKIGTPRTVTYTTERSSGGQIDIPEGYFFDYEGYNAAVTNNRTGGLGGITVNPANFLYRPSGVGGGGFTAPSLGPGAPPAQPRPTPSAAPAPGSTSSPGGAVLISSNQTGDVDASRPEQMSLEQQLVYSRWQQEELMQAGQIAAAEALARTVEMLARQLADMNANRPPVAAPSSARPPVVGQIEVRLPSGASLLANDRAQADRFMDEIERSFRQFGGSLL